ncbi:major facilitator superfamily domain-containing protein [Xylariomycetidae sp. FL0641]|nr:major facilitator superfamily domain-containing protein [Xylariomycetidae sp. FL0641]
MESISEKKNGVTAPDASSNMSSRDNGKGELGHVVVAAVDDEELGVASPTTRPAAFAHLDEKKLLRKMDLRLVPPLAALHLLAFLDRANLAGAKLAGLDAALALDADQYTMVLAVFFVGFAACAVPANLALLRLRLRPRRWLPLLMLAWGAVASLMGIVEDYHGLLAARFALGVAEAGLYSGCAWYLTIWYSRHEMQYRQALFFAAASFAGAFSGLLAFGVAGMDGLAGLEGWRWVFHLEGIITILVAVLAFFVIYDDPETASFLTAEERAFVAFRLRHQGGDKQTPVPVAQAESFRWKYVLAAFLDWQVWTGILVYFGAACPLYSITLFLPTIIKDLGFEASTAQLLTVPMYLVGAVLAVVVAHLSDRVGKRSPFVIGLFSVAIIGFAMCIGTSSPQVGYAGVFIATVAVLPAFPGVVTWLSNNLAGSTKRNVGMAIQIGIGNFGGVFAARLYREKFGPRYYLGHGHQLGFIVVGTVAALAMIATYTSVNKRRADLVKRGEPYPSSAEELAEQGDRANSSGPRDPMLRYLISATSLCGGALAMPQPGLAKRSITCLEVGATATATWTNGDGQTCTFTGLVGSNFGKNDAGGEYSCNGRCGAGCDGAALGNVYTQDCFSHDVCSYFYNSSGGASDPNCGDAFGSAVDDTLFGLGAGCSQDNPSNEVAAPTAQPTCV